MDRNHLNQKSFKLFPVLRCSQNTEIQWVYSLALLNKLDVYFTLYTEYLLFIKTIKKLSLTRSFLSICYYCFKAKSFIAHMMITLPHCACLSAILRSEGTRSSAYCSSQCCKINVKCMCLHEYVTVMGYPFNIPKQVRSVKKGQRMLKDFWNTCFYF